MVAVQGDLSLAIHQAWVHRALGARQQLPERRGRDSNPRTKFPPSRDFQSRPFNRSGTSPGVSAAQGYATRYSAVQMLAFSEAVDKTFGLVVVFGGIGVVVNVLLLYIFVQVRGEHQQNEQYRAERQRRFGD